MKQLLFIIFLFASTYVNSQIDTLKVLQGEWRIKYYKESTDLLEWSESLEKETEIKNDSTIILKIKNDSITIMRQSLYRIDTIKYTFHINEDTSKDQYNSGFKYSFIMKPSSKKLKSFRKNYRNYHKEIKYYIPKLTNCQLELKSLVSDNVHFNPFFLYTTKYYYFEKIDTVKINEQNFKGQWFCSSERFNLFGDQDTIALIKDTMNLPKEPNLEVSFNLNPFRENSINIHEINLKEFRVMSGVYFYNWKLIPNRKQIIIKVREKEIIFNYKFQNKKLLLIKNGS